jgi:hypothetical protein
VIRGFVREVVASSAGGGITIGPVNAVQSKK